MSFMDELNGMKPQTVMSKYGEEIRRSIKRQTTACHKLWLEGKYDKKELSGYLFIHPRYGVSLSEDWPFRKDDNGSWHILERRDEYAPERFKTAQEAQEWAFAYNAILGELGFVNKECEICQAYDMYPKKPVKQTLFAKPEYPVVYLVYVRVNW